MDMLSKGFVIYFIGLRHFFSPDLPALAKNVAVRPFLYARNGKFQDSTDNYHTEDISAG